MSIKIYFQCSFAAVSTRKNSISDLNREKDFQFEYKEIKIIITFSKIKISENQKLNFSPPRARKYDFI